MRVLMVAWLVPGKERLSTGSDKTDCGCVQAVGASERVFQLLDRAPRMPASGTLKPFASPDGGEIHFKDVW